MNIKKEYARERKRISNYISRLNKEGAEVGISMSQIPYTTNPTEADLEYVKSINAEFIQDLSYFETEYGVVVDVKEGRQLKRESMRKRSQSENLVGVYEANWYAMIAHFPNSAEQPCRELTQESIRRIGRKATFIGIARAMEDGLILTWEIAYDDDLLDKYLRDVKAYLVPDSDIDIERAEYVEKELYS